MAYDSRYTALVGVAGEGDQDSPRQPQAKALFKLLLEYGAEPFDIQVLYNTHFSGDVLWWLDLIYTHTMNSGRKAEWKDPNWMMLDMGGYGSGAQFLLRLAVKKNNLELAEWCLKRGARPFPQSPPFEPKHEKAKTTDMNSLRLEALRQGFNEMADLLVRYGASASEPVLEGEEAFAAACFRLDREQVAEYVSKHPEYLTSAAVIFEAAQRDRDDVVALLLDLGVPIEIEERGKKRLLHGAAVNNSLRVARLLIKRGAEVDPLDGIWGSPPIGWAVHADHQQMIDFLSRFSRNIWRLVFWGYVDRVREVLETQPELAKSVSEENITPLWWLPDDEKNAVEIVKLLLAHGTDPAAKSEGGTTAADWARRRGMSEVVKLLEPSEGLGASY
jgi:ankyrin repeat protein